MHGRFKKYPTLIKNIESLAKILTVKVEIPLFRYRISSPDFFKSGGDPFYAHHVAKEEPRYAQDINKWCPPKVGQNVSGEEMGQNFRQKKWDKIYAKKSGTKYPPKKWDKISAKKVGQNVSLAILICQTSEGADPP